MNYYDILNVKKDATQTEIRKSYKSLIKKYHPDIYDGDKSFAEKKSMEINLAYDVLSNAESRQEYDLELEQEESQQKSNQYSNTYDNQSYNNSDDEDDYDSYTDDIFMNQFYQRYNKYKNDYIFHKNYNKNSYTNYKTDKATDFYTRHVENAENYVYNKINKLESQKKLALLAFFMVLTLIFFLSSVARLIVFLDSTKEQPQQQNTVVESTYDPSKYKIINGLDSNTVSEDNNGVYHIEDYKEQQPQSSKSKNIDTSILDGLTSEQKENLQYYLEFLKSRMTKKELAQYTDEELLTILYYYIYEPDHFDNVK